MSEPTLLKITPATLVFRSNSMKPLTIAAADRAMDAAFTTSITGSPRILETSAVEPSSETAVLES